MSADVILLLWTKEVSSYLAIYRVPHRYCYIGKVEFVIFNCVRQRDNAF
jgi:hypothetical protein